MLACPVPTPPRSRALTPAGLTDCPPLPVIYHTCGRLGEPVVSSGSLPSLEEAERPLLSGPAESGRWGPQRLT